MEGPPADERLRWRRGDDGCSLCSLETETEADEEAVATRSPASKEPDLRGESQLIRTESRSQTIKESTPRARMEQREGDPRAAEPGKKDL